MSLMKKIQMIGLEAVTEDIKDAQLDYYSITELVEVLTDINQYMRTHSSIPLEQIQNQLSSLLMICLF